MTLIHKPAKGFVLMVLLLTFGLAQGQSVPLITIKGEGITIRQALEIVEKQSSFTAAYDHTKVNVERKITIDKTNASLTSVLDAILKNANAQYRISGSHIFITPKAPAPPKTAPAPKTATAPEPVPEPVVAVEPEPVQFVAPPVAPRPSERFLLKSNVLHLIAPMFNLGVEFPVARKLTLDVPLSYGPASWIDGDANGRVLFQPEVRRWFGERLHGHFAGVFAHISSTRCDKPFADGTALYGRKNRFGAGVSYGYRLRMKGRWGVEGTVGIGAAYVAPADAVQGVTVTANDYSKVNAIVKAGITFSFALK